MDTNEFLRGVLAEDGYYCLLRLLDGGKEPQNRRQSFYNNVDELLIDANQFNTDGWDVYMAMGTFSERGKRTGERVQSVKAFFLDLDIDLEDDKKYSSQSEALSALKSFCKELTLPKPCIVNSGRGIHVHWGLDEAVPKDEWQVVAKRFKEVCKDKGLLADHAITSDCARVLRIPNTHNHKTEPPTEVGFVYAQPKQVNFDAFAALLGYDTIPIPTKIENTTSFMDAIHSNITTSFEDIIHRSRVGTGCEQLRRVVDEPDTQSEPVWVSAISIAKKCDDGGREKAHEISMGYEGYDADQTDVKYDNVLYPHTCATFDQRVEDICPDCPHFGKIKSPIVLGQKIAEAEAPEGDPLDIQTSISIPAYPAPYFRGMNGGVYLRTSGPDGEVDEKLIYLNDLYVVSRIRDPEAGEAIVMRLHLPRDPIREFTVPLTAVTSREEFRKHMSMQGVAVTKMDELMQYTTTWVHELQADGEATDAHTQFGWTNDETLDSFILGDKEIFADRTQFNPATTKTAGLLAAFEPKGTLEEWKEMINFYNQPDMELHQFVVCSSFGSVLMPFNAVNNSLFHIHSKESGAGKTTAMLAAASVWGKPKSLVMKKKDTENSRYLRCEVYKNLPLFVDEVTNSTGTALSDFAYAMTSGEQPDRMTATTNTARHRGEPWKNLTTTTGNTSIRERVAMSKTGVDAEIQRVLEKYVDKHEVSKLKAKTDAFARQVEKVYGHAGLIYVQYILQNVEAVRKLALQIQARVDKEANLRSENRFWSVHVAMSVAGGIIARKLGLIDYDMKALYKWAINMLQENNRESKEAEVSLEQVINEYMFDNNGKIIQIRSTDDLRKQNDNGLDQLVIPEFTPRGEIVGRYETDTKTCFLMPTPLKKWCAERQINYGQFLKDLTQNLGAKKQKVRIAKGTQLQLPPTTVIVFNCDIDIDVPSD